MVRVRIAPSPTGDPHVGTAYIGLFNYVFAKKNGGQFILRIEDTDRTRSHPKWEQAIIESLKWVGLKWDEGPDIGGPKGPYRQSERSHIYKEHAEILLKNGTAYRCFCTEERLEQMRVHQKALKQPPGYDGLCRNLDAQEIQANLDKNLPFTVRLRINKMEKTIVKDKLRGEVEFDNAQVDDQILLKSDGFPTYHLANVVDDHLMEITHVIRAEEWISSTPKHIMLYNAFGWKLPEFIHMPLLRNDDKSKISKRKNPVSLVYYQQAGFLPQAMLNFLGLMGWSMPDDREMFSLDEMIQNFNWDRISLGGPVFDLKKLTWLNGRYIRETLNLNQIETMISNYLLQQPKFSKIIPLIFERIEKLEDFVPLVDFFFKGSLSYNFNELLPKGIEKKPFIDLLKEFSENIDSCIDWTAPTIEQLLRNFCDEKNIQSKILFMPIRIIVTGKTASPPLFETMEVLGRELCRRRVREAIQFLSNHKG